MTTEERMRQEIDAAVREVDRLNAIARRDQLVDDLRQQLDDANVTVAVLHEQLARALGERDRARAVAAALEERLATKET